MTEIIISGSGPSRYLQTASSEVLGRQYDNISEAIRVHKPEAESDKTCLMTVKYGQKTLDVIEVGLDPIDIRNHISQYPHVDIGFGFVDKVTGYAKNSEIKRYTFEEAIRPSDFVPETSAQSFLFSKLLAKAHCNVVASVNKLFFYDVNDNLLKVVEIDFSNLVMKDTGNDDDSQKIRSSLNVLGELTVNESASFEDDVRVQGDLYIHGTTHTVDTNKLIVKDNVIVANSGGSSSTMSGLVIDTGDSSGYGIMYVPDKDAVCVGFGSLYTEIDSEGNESVTFEFYYDQAIPLAARSGEFYNNDIPVWDTDKNAFKSSGKNPTSFVNRVSNSDAVTLLYMEKANNAGQGTIRSKCAFSGSENYSSVPYRNAATASTHPGTFEISHPELDSSKTAYSAKHPMTVGIAESRYVRRILSSSGTRAYTEKVDGTTSTMRIVNSDATEYTLVQRTAGGRIVANNPLNDLDVVNKQTLEAAIAALKSQLGLT